MSTYTTYNYNSGVTLTEALTWFPDNTNNEIEALDVRNIVRILWERMDYTEANPYIYINPEPTTIQVGGVPRGYMLDGLGVGDILTLLFYPYVAPTSRINVGTIDSTNILPIEYGSTNISIAYNIIKGSENITSIQFKNGTLSTPLTPTNLPTQSGNILVNIENNIIGDSTVLLDINDGTNTISTSVVFKVYPKYYYGAVNLNSLVNPLEPIVDFAMFPGQIIASSGLITNSMITAMSSELRQNAIGFGTKVALNNQHLVVCIPTANNNNISMYVNGMLTTSFKKVKTTVISTLSYDVWVSNTPQRDGIEFQIK